MCTVRGRSLRTAAEGGGLLLSVSQRLTPCMNKMCYARSVGRSAGISEPNICPFCCSWKTLQHLRHRLPRATRAPSAWSVKLQ